MFVLPFYITTLPHDSDPFLKTETQVICFLLPLFPADTEGYLQITFMLHQFPLGDNLSTLSTVWGKH